MKPVFRCEYCNFMGTEEDVKQHELTCYDNYDRKSCLTCSHKFIKTVKQYGCRCGKEIPEGKIFEFCGSYERKEKTNSLSDMLFGDIFGG